MDIIILVNVQDNKNDQSIESALSSAAASFGGHLAGNYENEYIVKMPLEDIITIQDFEQKFFSLVKTGDIIIGVGETVDEALTAVKWMKEQKRTGIKVFEPFMNDLKAQDDLTIEQQENKPAEQVPEQNIAEEIVIVQPEQNAGQ